MEETKIAGMQTETGKASFEWSLTAYEKQGNLWLRWTYPNIRVKDGKIVVYKDGFPSNPDNDKEKSVGDQDKNQDWDTGLRAGSNWNCAYIGKRNDSQSGDSYRYMIKITTKD